MGTPRQMFRQCDYLIKRGITAISAEYRVKRKHKTTPFECVEDAASALKWVKDNAAKYNIDPAKIIAGGASAGGHIAISAILFSSPEELSCTPVACVMFNPVLDTTEQGYGAEHFGEDKTVLSPTHHVRPNLPPVLVMHGTADTTITFDIAEKFVKKMKDAGNTAVLVPFEGGKHGYFNYGRGGYASTIKAMDEFLTELGLLPQN